MRSLQSKLGIGLVLSLVTVFAALWFLVSFSIQYLAEDYVKSRLRHDAEMLLSSIRFDNRGTFQVENSAIDNIYNVPFSGHYYVISSDARAVSSRSLWDRQLVTDSVRAGTEISGYQPGPDNQELLAVTYGFVKQGYPLTLTVAEDMNPVQQSIRQFQRRFAATALVMLLLLVVLQVLILRYSLRSLFAIRGELQSLHKGDTTQLQVDTPTELKPVVDEINHLLRVTDQRLRRSRDALGDLAHSIKRPLTIIQQIVNRNRGATAEDVSETLIKQASEINRLTERILQRARIAGHGHSGVHFSFSRDLPQLVETLDMMHGDKTIATRVNYPEETNCPIDREDMLELLGNLLDNAYKWANSVVEVRIAFTSGLTISIEDDGPGAEPEHLQRLDQRGVRLDESKQGFGFGLGIASDLVREYGGTFEFGRSKALGGFKAFISLPVGENLVNRGDV